MLSCAEQPATLAGDAIDSLRERGFAILDVASVAKVDMAWELWTFLDATIARFLDADGTRREAAEFLKDQRRATRKQYLVKPAEKPTLHHADPLLRLGLCPTFLEIARGALPTRPTLFALDLWLVLATRAQWRTWSQNWHRDSDAEQEIKIFYFPFGVSADAGPLEYVEGSHTGEFEAQLQPNGYLPNDFAVPRDRVQKFTCTPRTLLLVNTHGIHRGGLADARVRVSANWTYAAGKQYRRRFDLQAGACSYFDGDALAALSPDPALILNP